MFAWIMQDQFLFAGRAGFQHFPNKRQKVRIAGNFLQIASLHRFGMCAEQSSRGWVQVDYAFIRPDSQNPLTHGRKNGLALLGLA